MSMPWKLYLESLLPELLLPAEGPRGIERSGHRTYVGGRWEEMGALQLAMLRSMGLQPSHYLLDIGCGSFRLGSKAITFLDQGRYLALEKELDLIEAGLHEEVPSDVLLHKKPEIIISRTFEFERFSQDPDFAIAQSLFTHLTPDLIGLCFSKLRPRMKATSSFLATFFETPSGWRNPARSHDRGYFGYTRDQMLGFGAQNGFSSEYIGDWKHPRGQVLVRYRVPA